MSIIGQLQTMLMLLIILMVLIVLALLLVFFIYKKNSDGKLKNEGNEKTGDISDSLDFLPIDDIRDDMIIDDNGQRFTAALICTGSDFYSDNIDEKIRKQTAYIGFWHTIRDDICFRQSPDDIHLGYTISKYNEAYHKLESQLYMVNDEYGRMRAEYDGARKMGQKIDPRLEAELIRLQNLQMHLAWRMEHIKDEIALCDGMSGNQTDNEKKQKIYVFSWMDTGGLQGLNLHGDALLERADKELDAMASRMIRTLSAAGVVARRARTADLIDLVRRVTHPYSGNLYGYADLQNETVLDDDIVRTDSYKKLKEEYRRELSDRVVFGNELV